MTTSSSSIRFTQASVYISILSTVAFAGVATAQQSGEHPGKAVYDRACAACHNNPEVTKSPSLETLQKMSGDVIGYALSQGKMQVQASTLSDADRISVVDYLAGRAANTDDWIASMMCAANKKVALRADASVSGFGFDLKNHRRLTGKQTGLRTTDLRNLELAWTLGFPKGTAMRAQPVIVGTAMFLPVAESSRLFAIDISGDKPCFHWVYRNDVQLRTSAAYGELPAANSQPARKVVVFADVGSTVHMLDAVTGERLWKQPVGLYQYSITTGTPVLHNGRVYAPVSQYEITLGANPKHECCKTHGAVVALDALTGKKIWTAHTMEEAKPIRDRGDGQMLWGPSGAPIWTSPAIDEKRGVLYVGTGEGTSEPHVNTTDAILAIDLKDGSIRWSFQATERDIFLTGCGPGRGSLNCPKDSVFRDVDFGASVIIAKRSNGADILLAGQKSGTVWALDPDNNGKLLWRRDFGDGSPLGGIHWGIAYDGERVFAPINRVSGMTNKPNDSLKPGIHAVKVDSGEVLWSFGAEPNCESERKARARGCNNAGMSGAPTVIDSAVVAGGLDGFLRAFDAKSGELLFTFDTAREFDTINGVKGNGGAIDNASIVAANGYLFVNSGYGMFGQMPGNVLLAFKPKTKK